MIERDEASRKSIELQWALDWFKKSYEIGKKILNTKNDDWTIIDYADLTPEKLKQFIKGDNIR